MKTIITVTSLLMTLLIITSSQIKSYTTHRLMRNEARKSLVHFESEWSRRDAKELYDSLTSGGQEEDTGKTPPSDQKRDSEKGRLNRRFSIKSLLSATQKQDESANLQKDLLQRLIQSLCAEERFYTLFLQQQEKEGRDEEQVLQLLIGSLLEHLGKIEKPEDLRLEKVYFEEENFRNFFAKLLGGRDSIYYPDLRTYVDTFRKDQQISLYLADPILLKALFSSEVEVEKIVQVRTEIYRDLTSGRISAEEGAERLRSVAPETPFDPYLSFKVSKTNPKTHYRPAYTERD